MRIKLDILCKMPCCSAWYIVCKSLSHVLLFAPWTIQSMGFYRPEQWSGWPFPSPGDLPNPGTEPRSPVLHMHILYQLSHKWSHVQFSSGSRETVFCININSEVWGLLELTLWFFFSWVFARKEEVTFFLLDSGIVQGHENSLPVHWVLFSYTFSFFSSSSCLF